MGPTRFYPISESTGGGGSIVASTGWIDLYTALAPLERAGIQFALVLVLAAVVVGMIPGFGTKAVTKSHRSPVISVCIGTPALLVVLGLASTGYLILDSALGAFFGVLFFLLGVLVVPVGTMVGLVAIGRSIAARLGRDGIGSAVVVAALCGGLAGVSLPATLAVFSLAAVVGTGASIRILFGAGGVTSPDERTVPPANKV
ncbi:hypothetical protein [Natrarchaeobaculum aegyptiacum]|uniref:Uncharacterized protein n=1 Tax=Natrarchaeobaculum aegyptiacum TaxID=745377 RepID=A0A2Z2HW02_9EURY|nr:hypothetical protein [Natrarchaeobaculum aegyptiacum]ARS91489.1 hypothetical protein B1756_18340 [Natrarchaeobaculum aegyptiacum]